MARSLPRYTPLNPRSLDSYGVGSMLLADNYDPIAKMDEAYSNQLKLEEAERIAEDQKRRDEIEEVLAAQGGSLEDTLARAEQEYLARGDFSGALSVSKARREMQPDPIEEAKQLAALYKSAQDVAGVDPAQGLSIVNQYRSQMGQQPLAKIPQPFTTRFTSDYGALREYPDGRLEPIPGFGPVAKREKGNELNPKDYQSYEFGLEEIAGIEDPIQRSLVVGQLRPRDQEIIRRMTGASIIQETGRPRATVEQAQEAMRRRGKPPYTAKQLDKLRAQGLVE